MICRALSILGSLPPLCRPTPARCPPSAVAYSGLFTHANYFEESPSYVYAMKVCMAWACVDSNQQLAGWARDPSQDQLRPEMRSARPALST